MNRGVLEKIGDMLYPVRCVGCDQVMPIGKGMVCRLCSDKFQKIGHKTCFKCGKPVETEQEFCLDCGKKTTTFLQGKSAFVYNHVMQKSMARFKYGGRQEYGKFYGRSLWEQYGSWIESRNADVLIPVPIHKRRRQKRGYNQAELIGRELSRYSKIPMEAEYLLRGKNTQPQKELSQKERLQNLSQAFGVSKRGRELNKGWKCAIIIDDIYTTGSTMEACSRVLYREGIHTIYFLCVCTGQGFED